MSDVLRYRSISHSNHNIYTPLVQQHSLITAQFSLSYDGVRLYFIQVRESVFTCLCVMLLVSELLEGSEHETVPSKDNSSVCLLLSAYLGTLLGTLKDFFFPPLGGDTF